MSIEPDSKVVSLVPQKSEPARVADNHIEQIAVNDQVTPAVGRTMHDASDDFNPAEVGPIEVTQKFVVVTRDIDDPRAFARLAQDFLDDVVVGLRPVPAGLELPAVDDVADEIDQVGI